MWTIEIKIIGPNAVATTKKITGKLLSDVIKKAIQFFKKMGPY